tara:strand:- start:14550 stop:15089 length:540 start_codon:yes stop_codon:yes gene_type:complete
MATYYSNLIQPEQTTPTTLPAIANIASVGQHRGRLRYSRAEINFALGTDLADDEVIRWLTLKSSDRIIELHASSDADWHTVATFNIGLYLTGSNHDGAVADEDRFGSAVDFVNAVSRTDVFKEAATLTDMDRGKPIWELLGESADTATSYDLTWQASANITASAGAVNSVMEVYYVSGD